MAVLFALGNGPVLGAAMPARAQTLSVQRIYAHLQATLGASGKAYYVAVNETFSGAAARPPLKEQIWVDGAHDVARQLVMYSSFEDTFYLKHVTVMVFRYPSQGHRHEFFPGRPFPTCHGSGIAASLLIGCPLYLGDNPMGDTTQNLSGYAEQAMTATYGGKPALLLQDRGVISNADGTFPSTARLYLDPTTYFPIARVTTTAGFAAGVETTLSTFAITAVNPSTFPHNFFDPASLGYRGVDAVMRAELEQVPSRFPVYWLGTHWKGTSVLGPLALGSVDRAGPHRLGLSYGASAHRFGPNGVELFESINGTAWGVPLPAAGPCALRQRIALSGGYAIMATPRPGSGCTGRGTIAAVVTVGTLKIEVVPTFKFAQPREQAKYRAHTSAAGLTAVLKALVRR